MPDYFRQSRIRKNLLRRAQILNAIRLFFAKNDYLEIETPLRIPAPAPERHIDAEPSGNWFLHTSPELCMKRLLAAGYERIFQICKCFRSKERGRRHLPELTLLEWYTANADYDQMMQQTQDLILFSARRLNGGDRLTYQGRELNLTKPWQRMSVEEAFDRFASIPMTAALAQNKFDEIMGLEIEPCLGLETPLFLFDYPAECGALARLKPHRPHIAERFELYMAGLELCNGFSELTDKAEQRQRFEDDAAYRHSAGKTVYPFADRFLNALDRMPPSTGNALGIDRLVMLFSDTSNIDEVVAFTPEEL